MEGTSCSAMLLFILILIVHFVKGKLVGSNPGEGTRFLFFVLFRRGKPENASTRRQNPGKSRRAAGAPNPIRGKKHARDKPG